MGKIEALNAQLVQKQLQRVQAQEAAKKAAAQRRRLYGPPVKPVRTSPELGQYFSLVEQVL